MKINSFIHRHGTLTLKERKKNTSISQYLYKTEFLFLRYSCHPRLGGCTRRGHDDTDCSPTQVGCYSTHGGWGGGGINRYSCDPRLGVCTRRGHNDTYCGPTQVGCCFTHGGGGEGFAGISKEWSYTSILCFDQGAYHDFLSFFWGGGGRDGGQLHLGIPSSKLDPCPRP